jgi:hypothetical protein
MRKDILYKMKLREVLKKGGGVIKWGPVLLLFLS